MSSSRRCWVVATSIGAVEALKDQGFARWNYPMRLLQQHAKAKYFTNRFSGKSSTIVSNKMMMKDLKLI